MSTPDQLLAQARRLREQAEQIEAAERAEREAFDALTPEQRVAELLHRHFARSHPGAGGAMDGGDEWGYEDWSGREHGRYVVIARNLALVWECQMPQVQRRVEQLAELLEPYTMAGVRRKNAERAERAIPHYRKEVHTALDRVLNEAEAAARRP